MPYVNRGVGKIGRLGDYDKIGDWTWEYYPPPYRFASAAQAPKTGYYPTYAPASYMGLGCGSCSGLQGLGCGDDSDCGCGCSSSAPSVDISPAGTAVGSIPNWIWYTAAALLLLSGSSK